MEFFSTLFISSTLVLMNLKILIATMIGGKVLKWKEPTNAKYKSIVDYITHDVLCLSHLEGIYDSMVFKDKYNVMIVYWLWNVELKAKGLS